MGPLPILYAILLNNYLGFPWVGVKWSDILDVGQQNHTAAPVKPHNHYSKKLILFNTLCRHFLSIKFNDFSPTISTKSPSMYTPCILVCMFA